MNKQELQQYYRKVKPRIAQEQKAANVRERQIAKEYFKAGPSISNLYNAIVHWYNSVPGLGGQLENGNVYITGTPPGGGIKDIRKLEKIAAVAREFQDVAAKGIQPVKKVKDAAGYYRKLGQGQLNKILNSGGAIEHTSGEKNLTLKKGKPRKGDYYIKIDRKSVPVTGEKDRAAYGPFNKKPVSARVSTSEDYSPNINDPEVRLFARTGDGKYKEIQDPLNNAELRIQPIDRRVDKSYINEKKRGSEIRLDDHSILVNSPRTTLQSSDYILDPYSFPGAISRSSKEVYIPNDNGIGKYVKIQQSPSSFIEGPYFTSKESPTARSYSFLGDDAFVPSNKIAYPSDWVVSTRKALEMPKKNSKELDLVREYIDSADFNVSPVFDSATLQHSLIDYYKNVYGVDLTGLDWAERAKFMQALKNRSGRELLFHSTNKPFTQWDPSKLASNTGNYGFFGRGLYATDVPTTDYGTFQIPLTISKPAKQIIIEHTPGIRRFTSPMQDADDALQEATLPSWHFKRGGRYSPDNIYSSYPGMDAGGRPDVWNNWLRDNNIDLVRAADSSKGLGIYAETLIPEHTSVDVKPLFRPLYELK